MATLGRVSINSNNIFIITYLLTFRTFVIFLSISKYSNLLRMKTLSAQSTTEIGSSTQVRTA